MRFGSWWRFARLIAGDVELGRQVRLDPSARLGPGPYHQSGSGRIVLGDRVVCDVGAVVFTYGGEIELGDDVYLGPYSVIYGHGGVRIGSDTLIAMHCSILSSNHMVPDRATAIRSMADQVAATTIGRDCWLGAGVRVLAGVTIGDGCIVGAGAVVTADLPAYSVAIGVPAKVVRYRPERMRSSQDVGNPDT